MSISKSRASETSTIQFIGTNGEFINGMTNKESKEPSKEMHSMHFLFATAS